MASTSSAANSPASAIARDFVRALNVLMRSSRLYGFDHQLTVLQLNDAWTRLHALQSSTALVRIGIAGNKLLINGEVVQTGQSEAGFVQLLSNLDVASIEFDGRANVDGLRTLASIIATAKPETLLALADENAAKLAGIQLNRVRFYEHSGPNLGPGAGVGDPSTVPAASSAAPAPDTSLLSAMQPAVVPAGTAAPENEVAVHWIVDLATRLNSTAPGAANKDAEKLDPSQRSLLERLLTENADHATTQQDRGSLLRIAEHLALRYASEQFQKGEIGTGGLRQLFDRFGGEITQLRSSLGEKIARTDTAAKEQSEELNRQFWANLPDKAKLSVLLSNDAWVIPAVDVQSFVAQLTARGDAKIGHQVIKTYCACIMHAETEARVKTANGIVLMSETVIACGAEAASQITHTVAKQLIAEQDAEARTRESATFVKLVQEACNKRSFPAVEQALAALSHIETKNPELAKELRPRVRIENRVPEFVRESIAEPRRPEGLLNILKRMPFASLAAITTEFARRTRRDDCHSLAELVRGIGPSASDRLLEMLRSGSPTEASASIGLLCLLSPETIQKDLAARVKQWPVQQQASVVRQIAASASEQRGELLASLLDTIDVLVLPLVVDELGFDPKGSANDRIVATASEEEVAPFIRLKAMEALGRLRESTAEPVLRSIITARKMFGFQYHDEMRVSALHALWQVKPASRQDAEIKAAFKARELELPDHHAETVQSWLRQRRYRRVSPSKSLEGHVTTSRGAVNVVLEKLSLGGGLGTRAAHTQLGSDGVLEVQVGFRSFRARVLIQELGARRVAFEIADMTLDDRWRLRQLLNEQLEHAPVATASAAAPSAVTTDAFDNEHYRV